MKHFTNFLTHKTHATKQLGKIANTLLYDIKCKEIELQIFKESLKNVEMQIGEKIKPFYSNENECSKDLIQAINKATAWNNEPITNNKPVKKQKK